MENEKTSNGNEIKDSRKPDGGRKELTPQQVQKRKKMMVYPLFFLIFAAAMWVIFSPSKADKENEKQGAGLNAELPEPKKDGIVGDKRDAYEQEQARSKQEERMRSLADFSALLGGDEDPEEYQRQVRLAPVPQDYQENPGNGRVTRDKNGSSRNALHSSASAYQDINLQLGSFYEQPKSDPEKEEMRQRIEELTARLEEGGNGQAGIEGQLALMERSYEMAARYMSAGQGTALQQPQQAPVGSIGTEDMARPTSVSGKTTVQTVDQVRRSVVSALDQPISDSAFVAAWSQPRNLGFHTAVGQEINPDKNTIAAVIHDSRTISDGEAVRLRLLEPMQAGKTLLPRNAVITGRGNIQGERLTITVTSLEYGGTVIPVELTAYDTDGQPGIFIPGSMEISAVKEIAANMGAGLGSSINITQQSAGEQLLTDLGRGAIQGTSQYAAMKLREVKVHLKAGYRLMLYQKEE